MKQLEDIIDSIEKTDENKILESIKKGISYLEKFKGVIVHLDKKPYIEFSKNNLSFMSDSLNSKISTYFDPVVIMPYVNFYLLEQYKLTQSSNSKKLLKTTKMIKWNIERIFELTEEIYDDIKKDMDIDYRKLSIYMPY
jgi:hypothetical protein